MWVLQLCHCYYEPFLDCARQYNRLLKANHYRVLTVYLTGEPNNEIAKQTESDEVIFLGYSGKQAKGLRFGAIAKLRKIQGSRKFKFCVTHRFKPAYVALLATHLPVLSVHHNYGDMKRLTRQLFMHLFASRVHILGVSDSLCKDIRSYLPRWPYGKVLTQYNHIDADIIKHGLLSKESARNKLKLPQNAWVIGNVGRLHPDKDQVTLIRAFAMALPNLPAESLLTIVGEGSFESTLKMLCQQLNVESRVIFTGKVENARYYYKAFDAFVCSSDHETFGMVLLEAMLADVPVICSENGGGAEVVRGAGLTFPLYDSAALGKHLIYLAHEYRTEIVEKQTLKLEREFTFPAAAKKFQNILKTLALV